MSLSYLKVPYFSISHIFSDKSNSFSKPILHWDICLLYELLPRKASKPIFFWVSLFASLNFCVKDSYIPDETCLNQDLLPVNIDYNLLNINGKIMLLLRYQIYQDYPWYILSSLIPYKLKKLFYCLKKLFYC